MRPKLYFTLQIVAVSVVSILILLISVFIFNFIAFSVRLNGGDALLGFGPRGWSTFFLFFPWQLFAFDAFLVIVLELMLRKFSFGYKIPALYLLAGLLFSTVMIGFVIDRVTPLNTSLYENHGHLPGLFDDLYGNAHRHAPEGDIYTITAIEGSTLTVISLEASTTSTVILPPNDPHATTTNLRVGQTVFIAGVEHDGVIEAYGIGTKLPHELEERLYRLP